MGGKFTPLMSGVNERSYALKQTCSFFIKYVGPFVSTKGLKVNGRRY